MLQPTLAKFGAASVDFLAAPFVANHQGLDLFLDLVTVSSANGMITVEDKPANYRVRRTLDNFTTGSIDVIATPPGATGSVLVWPALPTLLPNRPVRFTAVVVGAPNQQVTWAVTEENGGTITDAGVYTAPAIEGTYHVTARSVADATQSVTATIRVRQPNTLRIVQTDPGVFVVQADKLVNVGAMQITVAYDPAVMANPTVTSGPLASGALTAFSTAMSGQVRWAMVTNQPLSSVGTLFTINFDVLGPTPERIGYATAELFDTLGQPLEWMLYQTLTDITTSPGVVVSPIENTTPGQGGTPVPVSPPPPQPPAESAVPVPMLVVQGA